MSMRPKIIQRKNSLVQDSRPIERSAMAIALEEHKKTFDNIAAKSKVVGVIGPQLGLLNSIQAVADYCSNMEAVMASIDQAVEGLREQLLDLSKMRCRLRDEVQAIIRTIDKVQFAKPRKNKTLAKSAQASERNVQKLVKNNGVE